MALFPESGPGLARGVVLSAAIAGNGVVTLLWQLWCEPAGLTAAGVASYKKLVPQKCTDIEMEVAVSMSVHV